MLSVRTFFFMLLLIEGLSCYFGISQSQAGEETHAVAREAPASKPDGVAGIHKRLVTQYKNLKIGRSLSEVERSELQSTISKLAGRMKPTGDDLADIEALFDWFDLLPCDISELKNSIKIRFHGEVHQEEDEEKRAYIDRAKDGKLLLGLESYGAGNFTQDDYAYHRFKNVFQIDESIAVSLLQLTRFQSQIRALTALNKDLEKRSLDQFNLIDEMAHVFGSIPKITVQIKRPIIEQRSEALIALIEKYAKAQSIQRNRAAKEEEHVAAREVGRDILENRMSEFKLDDLRKVVDLVVKQILSTLRSPASKFRYLAPDLELIESQIARTERQKPDEKEDALADQAKHQWRDRLMLRSVRRLICLAAEQGKAFLVIRAGAAHIPGIYRGVIRAIKNAATEESVNLEVVYSPEVAHFLEKLRDHGKAEASRQSAKSILSFFHSLKPGTLIRLLESVDKSYKIELFDPRSEEYRRGDRYQSILPKEAN